jgi:hypothetical protein
VSRAGLRLPTRVGHADWGDNQFRGYSVARDLAGHETITSLLVLGIVGRRLDENERLMLDDLATVTSATDPRIWPLKMVRVASAYAGCGAAVAALTVYLEGAPIARYAADAPTGHHAAGRAAQILVDLRDAVLAGGNPDAGADAILESHCRRMVGDKGGPFGFGVSLRHRDERIDLLAERVAARGRNELPYWRLFVNAAEIFWRLGSLRPNAPVAMGAVLLDMGFTPAQIGPLMLAIGAPAFWANAFEGAEQAPACLRTLPADCVRYVGPVRRSTPRAKPR